MKKSFLVAGFVLFASGILFGQSVENGSEPIVLTVDKAVELALQNNITIKQSKMDLDMLELRDSFSWNGISPSLSLSGGVNGSKAGTFDTFADSDPTVSWSASGSVSLNFTPALATTIKSARLDYESGQMSYENTRRSIELSVRKTFYSLLYFNENLELQHRSLETARQTYESNLSKFNQGRLSEMNLLTSQYNYESKIPAVTNLHTTYENNLDNFKIILGLDLNDEIELTGSLVELAAAELNNKLLDVNIEELPSIKMLLKNIESSENSLMATRFSAYGPSLSLSGSDGTNGGIKPSSDPRVSVSYSATVRIPLDGYLPWSKGSVSVQAQKESLEKLKQNLEQTKKTTEISIRNSYNAIKQAKAQLAVYEKNMELMQKTYDMTRASYNAGSTDFLTLQKAEDNLYQAKYNVENQRYSIISAVLDLENTLGIEFGSLGE